MPSILENLWQEVEQAREAKAAFRVAVSLEEVRRLSSELPEEERKEWGGRVDAITLSSADRVVANREAHRYLTKLHQMVSVGTEFLYEEVVLILTLRTQLALYESHTGGQLAADPTASLLLQSADCLVLDILRVPSNRRSVEGALKALSRNWPVFKQFRNSPFIPEPFR